MLFFVGWVYVADGVPLFLLCGGCESWLPLSVLPDISPSRGEIGMRRRRSLASTFAIFASYRFKRACLFHLS